MKMKKQNFTLIELLVVIAIIAILASMLLPALNKARTIAKMSDCKTHLKQIGMSAMFYSQDFSDFMIPYYRSGGDRWPFILVQNKYLGNFKSDSLAVFFCLANTDKRSFNEFKEVNETDKNKYMYVDYGYNYKHIGSSSRYGGNGGITGFAGNSAKLSQIKKPSETLAFMDAASSQNLKRGHYAVDDIWPGTTNRGIPMFRHGNRLNILWVDGHVDDVKGFSSQGNTTPASLNPYARDPFLYGLSN